MVKKLDFKLMTGGSRPTECLSKEPYLLNIFLAPQFKVKDLDLEYFLLRFPDYITHIIFSVKIPRLRTSSGSSKLFSQQALRGLVDKTTAQQPKVQQFETDGKDFDLENFLIEFLDLIIHNEVPKLKLFFQQYLVDKTTAQQPKAQQSQSTGFHDQQTAAAETSGSDY